MQRYELDAWLGDNNSDLTDEQATDLLRVANQIEQRYPDPDDSEEAQSALTVAYRLMVEDPGEVIDEVADDLVRVRLAPRLDDHGGVPVVSGRVPLQAFRLALRVPVALAGLRAGGLGGYRLSKPLHAVENAAHRLFGPHTEREIVTWADESPQER